MICQLKDDQMRKEEFRIWLVQQNRGSHQTSDILSRASRVEKSLSLYYEKSVNLDEEYIKDKCESVLATLSTENVSSMPEIKNLPRKGEGLCTLKAEVKYYIKFSDSTQSA